MKIDTRRLISAFLVCALIADPLMGAGLSLSLKGEGCVARVRETLFAQQALPASSLLSNSSIAHNKAAWQHRQVVHGDSEALVQKVADRIVADVAANRLPIRYEGLREFLRGIRKAGTWYWWIQFQRYSRAIARKEKLPFPADRQAFAEAVWRRLILSPEDLRRKAFIALGAQKRLLSALPLVEQFRQTLPGTVYMDDPDQTDKNWQRNPTPEYIEAKETLDAARRITFHDDTLPLLSFDLHPFYTQHKDWYVEKAAQHLVARIEALGGKANLSNAYGPFIKGVFWSDEARSYFTPLTEDDYATDVLAAERLFPDGVTLPKRMPREEVTVQQRNRLLKRYPPAAEAAPVAAAPVIAVADKIDIDGLGFSGIVDVSKSKDKTAEIIRLNPEVLIVRSATKVTAEMMKQLPNLKVVLRAGHGTDNVDTAYAKAHGIQVISTGGSERAVSALALRMMAYLLQRDTSYARDEAPPEFVALEEWDTAKKSKIKPEMSDDEKAEVEKNAAILFQPIGAPTIEAFKGKTIGIVGYSRISQELARTAKSLGMDVMVTSPSLMISPEAAALLGYRVATLNEMADQAHFIVPLTGVIKDGPNPTVNMFDAALLDRIAANPKFIGIIDVDRLPIIDQEALLVRLHANPRMALVIDEKPTNEALRRQVIYTLHIGASTPSGEKDVVAATGLKLREVLEKLHPAPLAIEPNSWCGKLYGAFIKGDLRISEPIFNMLKMTVGEMMHQGVLTKMSPDQYVRGIIAGGRRALVKFIAYEIGPWRETVQTIIEIHQGIVAAKADSTLNASNAPAVARDLINNAIEKTLGRHRKVYLKFLKRPIPIAHHRHQFKKNYENWLLGDILQEVTDVLMAHVSGEYRYSDETELRKRLFHFHSDANQKAPRRAALQIESPDRQIIYERSADIHLTYPIQRDDLERARDAIRVAVPTVQAKLVEAGIPMTQQVAHHLTKAVRELIDNAVDAVRDSHQRDGRVRIAIVRENDEIALEVEDSGVGMAAGKLRKLHTWRAGSTKDADTHLGQWAMGIPTLFDAAVELNYLRIEVDTRALHTGAAYKRIFDPLRDTGLVPSPRAERGTIWKVILQHAS